MNGLTDEINKLHHAFEELRANAATFRTIVNFKLDMLSLLLLIRGKVIPPLLERINNKITCFRGTAEDQVKLSTILIDNPTRNIFGISRKVVVTGSVISSRLAPTSEITDIDCGFTIHTQACDTAAVCLAVVGLDVVENGVRFGDFF